MIPLNKKGENLPLVGTLLALAPYGCPTRIPSTYVWVSSASPPRTNNLPFSPTVCVPGKVSKAEIIFPAEPAVVTISNGFNAVALLLSPALKVPAVTSTAFKVLRLSLIVKTFN